VTLVLIKIKLGIPISQQGLPGMSLCRHLIKPLYAGLMDGEKVRKYE